MTSPLSQLRALAAGRLSLQEAFWTFGVFWGVLLNAAASILSLIVLVIAKHVPPETTVGGLAPLLALLLHLAPLPYNTLAVVGIWRSSAPPKHAPTTALVVRAAALVLFVLFLLI